jgi:sister-chromatid-cohesion protein PDS5
MAQTLRRLRREYTLTITGEKKSGNYSVVELLKKNLKDLHEDLRGLPQGATKTDLRSLDTYSSTLIEPSTISHGDQHVRLLTACCLSEILRIYAPEAPYSSEQLVQVFDLFIQQFRQILTCDASSPWYAKLFTLIETIATVRISVLLADIDAEETILELFRACFDMIA